MDFLFRNHEATGWRLRYEQVSRDLAEATKIIEANNSLIVAAQAEIACLRKKLDMAQNKEPTHV